MPKGKKRPTTKVEEYKVDTYAQVEMTVTKEDVAAIQVSRVETDLTLLRNTTDAEIKKAEQSLQRLEADFLKAVTSRVTTAWLGRLAQVQRAFKQIGLKVEVKVSVTPYRGEGKNGRHIAVRPYVYDGKGSLGPSVTMQYDRKEKSMMARQNKGEAALEALREKALDIRKHLAQIPVYERQARASAAESVLKKTAAGRDMLHSLPRISPLGLPAPK